MQLPTRRALAMLALASACGPAGNAQDFNAAAPNASGQTPAFESQTRAPVIEDGVSLTREVVADGLEYPWGMDQLPDGRWIVTERPGRMRIVAPDGTVSEPVAGLPEVDARGQGGLLDVTIGDGFASERRLWWSYAEPRGDGTNATAVATGILSEDGSALGMSASSSASSPAGHRQSISARGSSSTARARFS